ncbi:hypothetical protein QUB05_13540 [Microcoleus sp. F10-C6]|uniref:hypothetical protein n=1 Tax=unclassified Microcoleus TaxID=2642155 RepID=UPI002FD72569
MTKLPSVPGNNLVIEMAKCLQKFLPQAYTTVSSCEEKKGSVRTKRIEALYTKSGGENLGEGERGRGGEGENFYFSVLPSSFSLLPTDIGLTSVTSVTSVTQSVAEPSSF